MKMPQKMAPKECSQRPRHAVWGPVIYCAQGHIVQKVIDGRDKMVRYDCELIISGLHNARPVISIIQLLGFVGYFLCAT